MDTCQCPIGVMCWLRQGRIDLLSQGGTAGADIVLGHRCGAI